MVRPFEEDYTPPMPFTPFHMGPALAVKAVAGSSFSVMMFGFSQVALDIEPLIRLLSGERQLHGFSHTYLGATLIGIACVIVGRPICQVALNFWTPEPDDRFMTWLRGAPVISWQAAVISVAIAVYSHVFIDSLIHPDMEPFAPFDSANPLLGLATFQGIHLICVGIGVLGVIGMCVRCAVESGGPAA